MENKKKNKEYALSLLKKKINGEEVISFVAIADLTGYSEKHIRRLYKEIENKDIDSLLIHSNTGKPSHNSASNSEIEYIRQFK